MNSIRSELREVIGCLKGYLESERDSGVSEYYREVQMEQGAKTAKERLLKELYKKGKIADVEVKNYLLESLLKYFAPARERYRELLAHPERVKKILQEGTQRARKVASQTMKEIRETIGLTNKYSFFEY